MTTPGDNKKMKRASHRASTPDGAGKALENGQHALLCELTADQLALFRALPAPGVITTFPEGSFLDVNEAWIRTFGYSREETSGQTSTTLKLFAEPQQREQLVHILSEQGAIYNQECDIRHKSGIITPYLVSITRIQIAGQLCSLTVLQDISKQRALAQSLEESLTKFCALLDGSRDAIGVSKAGIHEYVNPAYLHLFGYSSFDELFGRPLTDLIAPACRAQIQRYAISRFRGEEVPDLYETCGLRRDGTVFDMEIKASVYELNGERYTLGLIRDITERKRAEEAVKRDRAFLASAINLLPFPIFFLKPDWQVVHANTASQHILQLLNSGGWQDTALLKPETRTVIPEQQRPLTRALSGETVTALEVIAHLPDGEEFPALISASPIYIGDVLTAAAIAIQDITALKEADQAKNQFIKVISHEMRTPITTILGWAQLAESDTALCSEAMQVIRRSAKVQQGVLDRLILLSRMLTGKLALQRESVDLWQIATQAFESCTQMAAERQITLRLSPPTEPLITDADRKLLLQVMRELLDNALKYTTAGGEVTLTAGRMDDRVMVVIQDTGIGIAADELPKLWRPFQQIVREETLGGLGIGLVLVRGIIEAHGGQVIINSSGLSQGTTFTVALPATGRIQDQV